MANKKVQECELGTGFEQSGLSNSEAAKPQRACHASRAPKASMVTAATYMLLAGSTVQAQDQQIAPANEDLMNGAGKFMKAFPVIPDPPEEGKEYMYQDAWIIVSPESYNFSYVSSENAIQLTKKTGAEGFFDDGLTYLFQQENQETGEIELAPVRPGHIHFEVYSEFEESMEFCDFRFYTVEKVESAEEPVPEDNAAQGGNEDNNGTSGDNEDSGNGRRRLQENGNSGTPGEVDIGQDEASGDDPEKAEGPPEGGETEGEKEEEEKEKKGIVTASPKGPNAKYVKKEFSDVAFFRLGYFDYLKLNTQNMLKKYESGTWYDVDLILDYDEQRVSIYINNEPLKSAAFFTQRKDKLADGNAVSIYGLSPSGVSQFRNIQMCEQICSEQLEEDVQFTNLSGSMAGLGSGFAIIMGLSTLLVSIIA